MLLPIILNHKNLSAFKKDVQSVTNILIHYVVNNNTTVKSVTFNYRLLIEINYDKKLLL